MPLAETLAEAGDADLDREAEVARLEAQFAHQAVERAGPGEIRLQQAGRYGGHLLLSRSNVIPSRTYHGPEQFLG